MITGSGYYTLVTNFITVVKNDTLNPYGEVKGEEKKSTTEIPWILIVVIIIVIGIMAIFVFFYKKK